MRKHYRNGLDILDTKGSCRFAPKQVLVTVLRVVCMPGIRISFLSALFARILRWHVGQQHFAQQGWQHVVCNRGTRSKYARVLAGFESLLVNSLMVNSLLAGQPEQLRDVLRYRVVIG